MIFDPKYGKEFFIEYHRKGSNAYRDKVRFYEENADALDYLDHYDRIDVELDYLICLFEIGKYNKFLRKVDPLIETVIVENIYQFNGKDIYQTLLFKKASSLYNVGKYVDAERVFKALIKMEKSNQDIRFFYAKCKRKQERVWYEGMKAAAVVSLLSALSIAFMELLIVKPFYNDYIQFFVFLKMILFGLGVGLLILNELVLKYIIAKEIGYWFKK